MELDTLFVIPIVSLMIILLLQQNGCGGQMVKNGGYGVVKR